jgi:hypothetical protein
MAETDRVLKQFADQALACDHLGSPFTAMLCRLLATRLDKGTSFGRRILEWPGDPYADNVALRAAGALHSVARSGYEPDFAAVYPPNAPSEHTLWVAIVDILTRHDHFLADRLSSSPQTNEVARSGVVLGAMLTLAQKTGLPLDIFEIGASAGLNLGFDEYRYDLGEGRVWGPARAPLTLECAWLGAPPPLDARLEIVGRHGCDLRPIDPRNPADRERLMSYVWADQIYRLKRVEAALDLAIVDHRQVEEAEAADWLERQFAEPQAPGTCRVLFHTIVWQYLPPASKLRIEALLDRLGAAATAATPLARISIEADEFPARGARIDLTVWPTGETHTLGRGDFHGRWANWTDK